MRAWIGSAASSRQWPTVVRAAAASFASQLATASGSVAGCDLNPDTNRGNHSHGLSGRPPGVRFTGHTCDITDEEQVQPFRDVLLEQHGSDHVDLVRANAWTSGATV